MIREITVGILKNVDSVNAEMVLKRDLVLVGGKGNPQNGRVEIESKIEIELFKDSKKEYGERSFAVRVKSAGKSGSSWGSRLDKDLPIITHKGDEYLEYFLKAPVHHKYYLDGVEVESTDIIGLPNKSVTDTDYRRVKFKNIVSLDKA